VAKLRVRSDGDFGAGGQLLTRVDRHFGNRQSNGELGPAIAIGRTGVAEVFESTRVQAPKPPSQRDQALDLDDLQIHDLRVPDRPE
jgi:hypothetical protein